jgi:hypothetical protein
MPRRRPSKKQVAENPLAERMRQVLERRGIGQREWCRRANMNPVHLSNFFVRASRDANATIRSATLTKLARGANVSIAWLATGTGSPEAPDTTPTKGGLSVFVEGRFQPMTPDLTAKLHASAGNTDEAAYAERSYVLATQLIHGLFTQHRVPEESIDPLVDAVLALPVFDVALRLRAGSDRRTEDALNLARLVVLIAIKFRDALALAPGAKRA